MRRAGQSALYREHVVWTIGLSGEAFGHGQKKRMERKGMALEDAPLQEPRIL